MGIKLSKPQIECLTQAVSDSGLRAVEHYPPVKKLLALGFIELKPRGGPFGPSKYTATDAGRAALQQERERHG